MYIITRPFKLITKSYMTHLTKYSLQADSFCIHAWRLFKQTIGTCPSSYQTYRHVIKKCGFTLTCIIHGVWNDILRGLREVDPY